MKILVTGACGFAGSSLARELLQLERGLTVHGLDNLARPGSENNRRLVQDFGVRFRHGDLRVASDLEGLPRVDWVIDAAAVTEVMAGVDSRTTSRQLVEHNLLGTVNILEFCRKHGAGLILLSTSRVYSLAALAGLPVAERDGAFSLKKAPLPPGVSIAGVTEGLSVAPPVSLYGATKLCAETLALEYGDAFGFPVRVDRCGVLAGAGQFGKPDQGIFSFWINSYLRRRPLRYIGFGGRGHQVRDCLHPRDLAGLVARQMAAGAKAGPRIFNAGGGPSRAMSLAQLSSWCRVRFGAHPVAADPKARPFDIPWMVMDSGLARKTWGWQPRTSMEAILDEIAEHARRNPGWLGLSAGR